MEPVWTHNMTEHSFVVAGMAYGSVRYYCSVCKAHRLDNDSPHHYPTWKTVSSDCDEAKTEIDQYEKDTAKSD